MAIARKTRIPRKRLIPASQDLAFAKLKQTWFCRVLLIGQNIKQLAGEIELCDEAAKLLELEEVDFEEYKIPEIRRLLKAQANAYAHAVTGYQEQAFANIARIKQAFGFSDVDAQLLLFASMLELDTEFCNCFEILERVSNRQFYRTLHKMLNVPEQHIAAAFDRQSLLVKTGLLKLSNAVDTIPDKLILLNGLSTTLLDSPAKTIDDLFADYVMPAKQALLSARDFRHVAPQYRRLCLYLSEVVEEQEKGCNVLLYGPPGTGKTQMIYSLAAELGLTLYEISSQDAEGDTLSGKGRISACQLAQFLLQGQANNCLLFDEIEDVFSDSWATMFEETAHASGREKAWVNQLLENNPVPTFWVSNRIDAIDPAFIRRFDIVQELTIPPASVRKSLLVRALKGVSVSEAWLDNTAKLEQLSPAIIERAAKVTKIMGESQTAANEAHLQDLIEGTLKAMGAPLKVGRGQTAEFYDPGLINTSLDVGKISAGLKRSKQGRLCLYGPPGTGKSAYARYLAEYLNMPLLAKSASDIIDCYIGNTEKNIAWMFEQAKQENALLLLDEADSFLQDRSNSRHQWEVSQVNELLMQMEHFDGLFICSTNLMDNLDSAVLRRFDFKLKFDYLKPEQAWILFQAIMGTLLTRRSASKKQYYQQQLAAMSCLTPGDFAAVRRKLSVLGESKNTELFLKSLRDELSFKPSGFKRSIGFGAVI